MSRHRWELTLRCAAKTERVCRHCGLIKVTRHEPADPNERGIRDRAGRLVWTEWWRADRDGWPERIIGLARMPPCDAALARRL